MRCSLRFIAASWSFVGAAHAQTTELVSFSSANANVGGWCWEPRISADGTCVLFHSESSNLVPGDTNGVHDIFVRDRVNGTTTRVSVDSSGAQSDGHSFSRGISGDGRFALFASQSSNLVPNDTNGEVDVFVHDRQMQTSLRVSVDSTGAQGNDSSSDAAISADGRYVAFDSLASNLVPGDTNGVHDIFVHDLHIGQTTRVSVDSTGAQSDAESNDPAISADGRFVAFSSTASNLVPGDTNGDVDIFVHDRVSGQTMRVSVASNGTETHGGSIFAAISADGSCVAFCGFAADVVPDDTNDEPDLFVHDRVSGQTTRVSVDSSGAQANVRTLESSLSANGRYVAFETHAYNLVPGDAVGIEDVFVHDRETGQTTRVSVSANDVPGNAQSGAASISADGQLVAFFSRAANLTPADTDLSADIFVRDRGPERITPFCASSVAACPCANAGAEHHGCASLIYPRGGYLGGYGTPSVASDSFLLQAQEVSGLTTLFYQGDAQMSATPLDDGLACVSGSLIRLGVRSNVGGVSSYPQTGDLSVSVRGMVPALGGTRYYQCWYRNALPFCTPATTNRTNGLIVVWVP